MDKEQHQPLDQPQPVEAEVQNQPLAPPPNFVLLPEPIHPFLLTQLQQTLAESETEIAMNSSLRKRTLLTAEEIEKITGPPRRRARRGAASGGN